MGFIGGHKFYHYFNVGIYPNKAEDAHKKSKETTNSN